MFRFRLCSQCAYRQGLGREESILNEGSGSRISVTTPSGREGSTINEECYICNGLLSRLDDIFKEMLYAVKEYDFKSFLIGCSIPNHMIEREDELRAHMKIKGRESIKGNISRVLGSRLASLGYTVDYMHPDIDIHLDLDLDNFRVNVRSRPIYLAGNYKKRIRGLTQKGSENSVESMIRGYIMKEYLCDDVRFSWIGGEDRESLVINGRPVFIKLINPRRTKIEYKSVELDGVIFSIDSRVKRLPSNVRFLTRVRVRLLCSDTSADSRVLLLNNLDVRFDDKGKSIIRSIHEASVGDSSISNGMLELDIDMLIDGGFMIKRFIDGESIPSIRDILGDTRLVYFDVIDVRVQ